MMERQVLVTRKLNTESNAIPVFTQPSSTEAPSTVYFSIVTDKKVTPDPTTTTPAPPTEAATGRSNQVPTESIREMMKILRKRPTGLFENKLAKMREQRVKLLSSARGKPKKPVVLKFTSK